MGSNHWFDPKTYNTCTILVFKIIISIIKLKVLKLLPVVFEFYLANTYSKLKDMIKFQKIFRFDQTNSSIPYTFLPKKNHIFFDNLLFLFSKRKKSWSIRSYIKSCLCFFKPTNLPCGRMAPPQPHIEHEILFVIYRFLFITQFHWRRLWLCCFPWHVKPF